MEAGKRSSSYLQILRSSSIVGGAQGLNYLVGLARTKAVALLLGPSGVGLAGLYASTMGLISTIAELGIGSSGVREVAEAHAAKDAERIAATVKTLRRTSWITGVLGWLATAALAYPLSLWAFGSRDHVWAIGMLGAAVLLSSISGGQTALLQGARRIGDLARIRVLGAAAGTIIAIVIYAVLGVRGIVLALIATGAANLGVSWWFSRRVPVLARALSWRETFQNSRRLVQLGVAFMYGAVLASAVALAVPVLIVREYGLEANGMYQAAWALSGMFASFILNAMGADFYPRLTAVAEDNDEVNRVVNEQIEIGVLLALPGLLATMTFAPWLMRLLFSAKFVDGAALLPWMAVAVFGQVLTFPLGFIQRAKGRAGWIFFSQTHINALHLGLVCAILPGFGLAGAAWAFAIATYVHGVLTLGIARRLSRFRWNAQSAALVTAAGALVAAGIAVELLSAGSAQLFLGVLVTGLACLFSLRGIAARTAAIPHLKLAGLRELCGNVSGVFRVSR